MPRCVFPFFWLSWAQRVTRRCTRQRLATAHLVERQGHLTLQGAVWGLGRGLTAGVTLLVTRDILDGVEPAAHARRPSLAGSKASRAEVIAHFGHGTAQRVTITARLERIYELARRTGSVQRFIIFGSYVTAEPKPRNVDIFLVLRGGFQLREAPPEAQLLFRHGTAPGELGASIFWFNAEASFADTEDVIIGWQTHRDLQGRGLLAH